MISFGVIFFSVVLFFLPIILNPVSGAYHSVLKNIKKEDRINAFKLILKIRFFVILPVVGLLVGDFGKILFISYLIGFIASGAMDNIPAYIRKLEYS